MTKAWTDCRVNTRPYGPVFWAIHRTLLHGCVSEASTSRNTRWLDHAQRDHAHPRPRSPDVSNGVHFSARHAAHIVPLRAPWSPCAADGAPPGAAGAGMGMGMGMGRACGGFQAAAHGAVADVVQNLGLGGGLQRRKRLCVARGARLPRVVQAANRAAGEQPGFTTFPPTAPPCPTCG